MQDGIMVPISIIHAVLKTEDGTYNLLKLLQAFPLNNSVVRLFVKKSEYSV
jgi:hypothetical protein